ncbi:NAD(P)H-hydrate dehydratase [Rhizobium sp. NFR03]|uniref:NAD(P)H-hydrate dehydratase n=1 Tax=Rhizobium sp. NFR03 TaxID=1566263 RepID=UPI0008C41D89|nr:NAD(P)H-hydrate dehydratase [Rhizobium sp. NFR03]SER43888.1 NAD(P)H-hydrate epimerase [Rhizobium sp. NFR03]
MGLEASVASWILTPSDMAMADRDAAASGISSFGLMRAAGHAVAASALRHYPEASRFVCLCGFGNNGGDAMIAAEALADSGADVAVYLMSDSSRLTADAARAFAAVSMPCRPLDTYVPTKGDVVIDGLFGAGLSRPISPDIAGLMRTVTDLALPVIAIDLPSGVDGRSGEVLGESFSAARTVTFMTRKPGHLLLPGSALCGALDVVDIGIPSRVLRAHRTRVVENTPALWTDAVQALDPAAHKYRRGHLVVFSGAARTSGAARMSATAGLSAGAGLVTMIASSETLPTLAAHLTAVMLKPVDDDTMLTDLLDDTRLNAFVLGPGFGVSDRARRYVAALSDRSLVLDADGITAFRDDPQSLFDAFRGPVRLVLTPHDGEFARLFPDLAARKALSKIDRATMAAERSNAIIILKGSDTVIAAPDGRLAINTNAPPWLATAGSGDVLAGIVGAHLAQGMPAFEAATSAVWRHGAAGHEAGEGMTAEDLLRAIAPLPKRSLLR